MSRKNSKKALTMIVLMFLILAFSVGAGSAQESAPDLRVPDDVAAAVVAEKSATAMYIVRMSDDPVISYDGSIRGLAATKPGNGQKINPESGKVVKYVDYLKGQHDAALSQVKGLDKKAYDYYYSFNGFAAELTEAQAAQLAVLPTVISVEKDFMMQLDTSRTPDFLGLTAAGGLWDLLGGQENAGEGVIVGIIDSGIWPENASFSDRTGVSGNGSKDGKLGYQQIPGWHGKCTPGEDFPASDCNQKLIGAQWFNNGWGGDDGVKSLFPYEFASALDADGHGSHTASTAAGNYGVPVVVDGVDLGMISGMAPRARIAAYKVCWGNNGEGGCFGSDSVAAIDQAVADGVDVLNFSISGTRTNYLDAVEVAFLFAADAGVFVAASAGNSGPGAGTVAHMSPWLTTVAAGTKDDFYAGTVTLGNGAAYDGASRATPAGPAELVYSADVGLAGADPNQVQLCYPGTLDPALVAGKIVACDRGTIARVDKSLAVAMAGGVGSILMNTSPSSLNADLHSVPTVHVDEVARAAILAYIAGEANPTASITGNNLSIVEAPFVAAFSSRGPNQAGGDLLKPDILAPGVDVLAAVSPVGYDGADYSFLSGTSMSGPHIAGLGALMTHAHPDWSPMMIKSALMTTASTTTNAGNPIPGGPFAYGAGHVVPNSAVDPGLVYDSGWIDWLGFLCGTGQLNASYCPAIGIDPSDLNYPSISIGELAGAQTVVRTVTNVGPAATYTVSVDAPAGVDVSVNPSSLTLAKGESASYTVTFTTQAGATIGAYTSGSLTWSHAHHNVTSPLVVRPVQLAAPSEIGASGTDGSLSFDVEFGYEGDYTAAGHGFVPSTQQVDTVVDDPANDINTALGTGVGITVHVVNVPSGTAFARFSLFNDYTDGDDDLDLYVFRPNGFYYGGSGSGTSAEEVNVADPVSGNWFVVVHGWQTDGPDANYTLFSWSVSGTPGGSLTIDSAPASATLGTIGTIDLSWAGLTAGDKYLGAVSHSDAGGVFKLTLVTVSTE